MITMINTTAALRLTSLLDQQAVLNVTFESRSVPGAMFGVSDEGDLVSVGWEKYPTLMMLGWEAQWLGYKSELRHNLSRPALTIPVFEGSLMKDSPLVRNVSFAPLSHAYLATFGNLELDMALSCPGSSDDRYVCRAPADGWRLLDADQDPRLTTCAPVLQLRHLGLHCDPERVLRTASGRGRGPVFVVKVLPC